MWSQTELTRHREAAKQAAISDAKLRLENSKFYRDAPGLSVKGQARWCEIIAELESSLYELENQ